MTLRFEAKIEEALVGMKAGCETKKRDVRKTKRQIGRLLAKNSRAAKLFDIKVSKAEDGAAIVEWSKVDGSRNWATLSGGCYMLRTNVSGWSDEELWKAYIQLTEAEAAFRIQKSDLSIRPIWHQKEDRVLAHNFCVLHRLRALEIAQATLHQSGSRQRATPRAGRTVRDPFEAM